MPQSGRNHRGNGKSSADLTLAVVAAFLRYIAIVAGALFFICLIACFASVRNQVSSVVYPLAIGVNLFASAGAGIGSFVFERKDRELTEKEKQKLLEKIRIKS